MDYLLTRGRVHHSSLGASAVAALGIRDPPSVVTMSKHAPNNASTTENSKPHMESQLRQIASSLNAVLKNLSSADERLGYVLQVMQESASKGSSESVVALTTSFGIQSALMLHMLTQAQTQTMNSKKVPVIWIDTGYLPPETYHFAQDLKELYDLDLHTYQSIVSPAHMEALHGPNLWEQSHQLYNYLRKVEPMQRALTELDVTMVVSGVRASQTKHRQQLEMAHVHKGLIKICPILDWSDQDVANYFDQHKLPYHPLYKLGYRTVGDQHSSQPFDPSIHTNERDTRFHGRAQECGLHLPDENEDHQGVVTSSSAMQEQQPALTDSGFVLYTKPKCRFCRAAKELIGYLRRQQEQQLHQEEEEEEEHTSEGIDEEQKIEQDNGVVSPVVVHEYQVGRDIQLHELKQRLGGRPITTVPQIWYEDKYIGGYDNLVEWVQVAFPNLDGLPDPDTLL